MTDPKKAESKFANFNEAEVTYKTVESHDIKTSILVPKNAKPGKYPVLVHFHGGFLIVGDKLFEDWWANWLIQLAESKSAIIISPNYRLLPESNGLDILSDLSSFWTWVQDSLATELSTRFPNIEADLSKILVAGESAGGYLSLQSPLLHPSLKISACISQYGMLDNTLPHFSLASTSKNLQNMPQQPISEVTDYMSDMTSSSPRSSTHPWELWLFILATVQHGKYLDFLGHDETLLPIRNLEKVDGVPAMWVIHGKEDSLVPIAASDNFVKKLEETHPETPLRYTVVPGEHGFDSALTMDEAWIKEGCAWIEQFWP